MLRFEDCYAAQRTLAGMEVMVMIKNVEMYTLGTKKPTLTEPFYAFCSGTSMVNSYCVVFEHLLRHNQS